MESENRDERLVELEEDWSRRIEEIKESEFSPKQCKNVYMDFTSDLEAVVSDVSIDFNESEPVLRSIRADLTVALEQAKANYREELGSPWEKVKFNVEKIEVKLVSLF
jgi:hypothetical protein